jgi:uncharacterized protein
MRGSGGQWGPYRLPSGRSLVGCAASDPPRPATCCLQRGYHMYLNKKVPIQLPAIVTSITLSDERKTALAELKPPDLTWDDFLGLLLESVEPDTFERSLRERTDRLHQESLERVRLRLRRAQKLRLLDHVRAIVKEHDARLRSEFKVKRMYVFGSVARGEENPGSDVDILVEYEDVPGLHELVGLEEFLEERIGRKVDLGTRLKPGARERSEREMIRVA